MSQIDISKLLLSRLPKVLVDQILETYTELKRNFYLSHLRPNEVEGGRFAEAMFRLLEYHVINRYTPLGRQLNTDAIIRMLSQLSANNYLDSIRLHIPRTLRVIYDIRNRRDAAHLADGIDPNLQDATLVTTCADWVMSEIVRLYHNCSPDEAQKAIDDLVTRKAPVVQEFGNMLKTLRPDLTLSKRVLVLLYHRGKNGASFNELSSWVKPSQVRNLRTTLWRLVNEYDLVYEQDDQFQLTRTGQLEVERKKLLELP